MEERENLFPVPGEEKNEAAEEPREIVSWYVPRAEEGTEVVEYYVQPRPLPGTVLPQPADTGAWKEAARREKKRRRRWLWIFLGCLAVLIAVILAVGFANDLFGPKKPSRPAQDEEDDDSDSPSSIIDIYDTEGAKTTIPTVKGDDGVRLSWERAKGEALTIRQVYQKVNPSTVTVITDTKNDGSYVGTGVILTPDGYIITNAHVITGGHRCRVELSSGHALEAKLVGYDAKEDLAVLKVQAENLPAADLGDSEALQVGDTVYAIGNPLGVELRGTLTCGIISAVNRNVSTGDNGENMTMLQTTAALNNGNSGGPLINEWGQVIGINTMKMSSSALFGEATVEALGFAIPLSHAAEVADDLIACGNYRGTPTLGITVLAGNREDGSPCLSVVELTEGYGGIEAGVQVGDLIVAADGSPVYRTEDLLAARRQHRIGESLVLTIERGGRTFDVSVPLYSSKKAEK